MRPAEEMGGPLAVKPDPDLAWREFDVPGGNMPAMIFPLRSEPETRASTLFVRFPAGWQRSATGFYESAEEFLMLDGSLTMTGEVYGKGSWVHVPERTIRMETFAESGALSLARFAGPARWAATDESPIRIPLHRDLAKTASLAPLVSPFDEQDGWLLRDQDLVSSWLLAPPPSGEQSPFSCEFVDLVSGAWFWVPKGDAIPHLEGLCFCRIFDDTGGAR